MNENELDPKQLNLWKKALLANEQKNWEYVVNLTTPLVLQLPLFMEARMLKRRGEGEMAKAAKKSLFGGIGGHKSVAKMDPWEGIAYLEENVFVKDPFNIKANQEFYELATRAGYPDLGAFGLETIRMGHPTNTKLMYTLAEHYMSQDQPDKAGEIYRAILKVTPSDMAANKGEKDAAARQSMKTQWNVDGGTGGPGSFRGAVKDAAEQRRLELRAKQAMTPEEAEEYIGMLSADYDRDNANINVVKEFGAIYEKLEEWSQALQWYQYAQQLNPADTAMMRKIELLQEKVADLEIKRLEQEVEDNPHAPDIDQRRADLAEIKRQRGQRAVEEAKVRVERNPTDKAYRFDLGQAYFNCGMYGEAIPELQQARQNPNLRLRALHMLGMCFGAKNMNDLAISALADAVKEMPVMDNNKKDILYDLSMLYSKTSRNAEYLDCLKEIYNHDYGYKDVAKRVEASYG